MEVRRAGGSNILTLKPRARLPGIYNLVQFTERGQRVAQCDTFGDDSSVFALVIFALVIHQRVARQTFEPVVDYLFGLLDALSQPPPVGLEQRDVKEFAP